MQTHDAFWAAARHQLGDSKGTRALVEVLLLHRYLPAEDVIAGIAAALRIDSVSPDVVAVEARKSVHPDGPTPLGLILPQVADLRARRAVADAEVPAALQNDSRPLPSVAPYDDRQIIETGTTSYRLAQGRAVKSPRSEAMKP